MPIKTSHVIVASKYASRSEHSEKHGAVMIKNGKVVATARNQYCSKKKLSHFHSTRIWSVHAEMSLAASVPKHVAKGSTVCVVRVNKNGQLVNSEPCEMCKKILIKLNVKNVYYS